MINELGEFWFGDEPIVPGVEIVALGSGGERAVGIYAPGRANLEIEAEDVRRLRDALTAWLDAPRDAARAAAEVVATESMAGVAVALIKTTLGEWGVRTTYSDDETAPDLRWYAGATAELEARAFYAEFRGFSICTSCGAETDSVGTIDVVLCAECAGGLVPA